MSEIVACQIEQMLPVYEEMKRKKLVSDTEIREIIKTRESFEYKINRQGKELRDFGEYIAYERHLLSTITEREKKKMSNDLNRKPGPVENFIAGHIKSLYKQALKVFPEEPRLWESYLKFCRTWNFLVEISIAFEKMLQHHGNEITIWLRAIKWEFQETGNMEKVKDLFLRGIQRHPDSEILYLEFFKIKLTEASKMKTDLILENNTQSERDIGLKRVEVIYNSSRQKISDVEYLIKILNILEEYPFTKNLQKVVIEDMMSSFPREELVWHKFALRELEGLNISDLMDVSNNNGDDNVNDETNRDGQEQQQNQQQETLNEKSVANNEGDKETNNVENELNKGNKSSDSDVTMETREIGEKNKNDVDNDNNSSPIIIETDEKPSNKSQSIERPSKRTFRKRIQLCCGVYEAAVKALKTEKMWTYYINTMLELNRDMSTLKATKRQCLANAFKGAFEAELLSKTHFESYIELLKESETKKEILEEIMKKSVELHPNSVTLWELWMEYYTTQGDANKVYEIFRKATNKLGSEGYSLWKILISYYLSCYNMTNELDTIFKEAVQFTEINFLQLRLQYLEWTLINKNIEKTRKLYDELTIIYPPYYDLHYTMALIESRRLKPDIERWRKCHENIIHYFGKDRTDVWTNYIKFEKDYGEPKNMSILYERAKNTLDISLVNQFISEYNFLITGIM